MGDVPVLLDLSRKQRSQAALGAGVSKRRDSDCDGSAGGDSGGGSREGWRFPGRWAGGQVEGVGVPTALPLSCLSGATEPVPSAGLEMTTLWRACSKR